MPGSTIRQTVIFSGLVQGVGFRWSAREIAREFELTGFVENLPDGTVRLVVEGEAQILHEFISRVQNGAGRVLNAEISQQPATGEYPDFRIQRS